MAQTYSHARVSANGEGAAWARFRLRRRWRCAGVDVAMVGTAPKVVFCCLRHQRRSQLFQWQFVHDPCLEGVLAYIIHLHFLRTHASLLHMYVAHFFAWVYACKYVYSRMSILVSIYNLMHAQKICAHMRMNTYAHARTSTRTHLDLHAYTHICACLLNPSDAADDLTPGNPRCVPALTNIKQIKNNNSATHHSTHRHTTQSPRPLRLTPN